MKEFSKKDIAKFAIFIILFALLLLGIDNLKTYPGETTRFHVVSRHWFAHQSMYVVRDASSGQCWGHFHNTAFGPIPCE